MIIYAQWALLIALNLLKDLKKAATEDEYIAYESEIGRETLPEPEAE